MNKPKIAVHHRKGSFSDRWIDYCQKNAIPFKIVNCYDSDILFQLKDCRGLMWHWSHVDYRAQAFARQLILSCEKMGIKVFPDYATCWHFDDKVGQKYLLEAIGAPLVPTHVFYDKEAAYSWIEQATFPKVFKLRGGAGSQNVKLVKTKRCAKRLVKKAFGKGFPLTDITSDLRQRLWILRRDRKFKSIVYFLRGLGRVIIAREGFNLLPVQKGYVYFQDFVPGNEFDERVVVIGNRAIAIRRSNRTDDFKASGSGLIEHDPALINKKAVQIAFEVAEKIGSQSLAFDFIYENGEPKIAEISYAYAQGPAYDKCPGYWDKDLEWHEDNVDPQRYIIIDFIKSIELKGASS